MSGETQQSISTISSRPCFRLNKGFKVVGRDFWGNRAQVELLPEEELGLRVDVGADMPILITPEHLFRARRSIDFRYHDYTIPIIEHALFWGWFATGMVIRTKDGRLPYGAWEADVIQGIAENSVEEGVLIPYQLPTRGITSTEGKEAFVDASSTAADSELTLDVRVEYPRRWGESNQHRIAGQLSETVTLGFLEDIGFARSLGHPPPLWFLSALAKWLGGWPHHDQLIWKEWRPKASVVRAITQEVLAHRCLDLLGVLLAATPPGHYPVGKVTSVKAGHRHDLDVAKQLFQLWLPEQRP